MGTLPKIPDDIYNNRCRYCHHFQKEYENKEVKHPFSARAEDQGSCKIQSIAGYCYQEHNDSWTEFTDKVYEDGECRSFTPNFGYPICESCEHFNHFKTDNYCYGKPKNRRIAVIGNNYGKEAWDYAHMICDNWVMRQSMRGYALEYVALGKLPAAFDPKTYKLLKPTEENRVAEEWRKIQEETQKRIEKENYDKEQAKKTDSEGQYRLF